MPIHLNVFWSDDPCESIHELPHLWLDNRWSVRCGRTLWKPVQWLMMDNRFQAFDRVAQKIVARFAANWFLMHTQWAPSRTIHLHRHRFHSFDRRWIADAPRYRIYCDPMCRSAAAAAAAEAWKKMKYCRVLAYILHFQRTYICIWFTLSFQQFLFPPQQFMYRWFQFRFRCSGFFECPHQIRLKYHLPINLSWRSH